MTPMLRMFAPSARDAAVGEEEGLDDQHHRHDEAGEPGPEQDRGQSGAEQVAAGAAHDGEVEHLDGEDERGQDAEQGNAGFVELDVGHAQAIGHRRRGQEPAQHRHARAQEAVRDVKGNG